MDCGLLKAGFDKSLNLNTTDRDNSSIVTTTFGSVSKKLKKVDVEKIIIHPDYWEGHEKHGNPYDLALIKMKNDVYKDCDPFENNCNENIYPICLPPRGPVVLSMLFVDVKPNYKPPWMRKNPNLPLVPFEDMDCVHSNKPEIGVRTDTDVQVTLLSFNLIVSMNFKECISQKGWLKCHPSRIVNDILNKEQNIQSPTSYISGFGVQADPGHDNGQEPFAHSKECRTNEYSPDQLIYK